MLVTYGSWGNSSLLLFYFNVALCDSTGFMLDNTPYTEPKVAWVSQLWVFLYGHPHRLKLSLLNRPGSSCIEIAQLRQSLSHHSSTVAHSL